MTDVTSRPRALRALAIAGAMGLALSPALAGTAFAAPGSVEILAPGATEALPGQTPQVDGCTFVVLLDGATTGEYPITMEAVGPTKDIPGVQGNPVVVVGESPAAQSYTFVPTEGVDPQPEEGYHLKVNAADNGNTVSSKTFVVKCDPANPGAATAAAEQAADRKDAAAAEGPAAPVATAAPQEAVAGESEEAPDAAPDDALAAAAPDRGAESTDEAEDENADERSRNDDERSGDEQRRGDRDGDRDRDRDRDGDRDRDRDGDSGRGEDESDSEELDSVPVMVNSGLDGGPGGLVVLGLGGVAVVGLAAAGVRRRNRG